MKDAAFAFFSYMSQPAQSNIDVTIGKTGDTDALAVTIYKQSGKLLIPQKTIVPQASLIG